MKKALSVFLAAVMLVSVVSVSVAAAGTITTKPGKLTYLVGEFFDPYGLKVKVGRNTYTYTTTNTNFSFDPDLATPLTTDMTSVKVYYNSSYVNDVAITVNGVITEPSKKYYMLGECFDPAGLSVKVNGTTYTYSAGDSNFAFVPSLTTPLAANNTNVKITYSGVECGTLKIGVNCLVAGASKTEYTVGEAFNPAGIKITYFGSEISYTAGSKFSFEPALGTPFTIDDESVKILYDGARLGEYDITVEGLITGPAASSVTEGEVLDPTGISTKFNGVTVNYEDDTANFTFSPSLDTPAELITDDVGNILPASYTVYYKGYKVGSFEISVVVFSFALNEDGNSYSFVRCDPSVSGAATIPAVYNDKPVTAIGDSAFYDCSSLTSVTIPDSVTSIYEYAFYCCSSLTSVNIPDGVTSIGDYAFAHCSSITSVDIPDSVTSIGNYAFSYCSSLASINVAEDNECYSSQNGVLFNKDKTELICCPGAKTGAYTIPSGVTSIGNHAFDSCSSLTSVTIGNSVTSIGNCAFEDCSSLTSVNIPDSVTSIGARAFYNCSSLTSVTIPGRVTSIGSYAFVGCSKNLVLYGFSDSTAESYASDNSITFRAVNILPKQFEKIDYANECIFSEKSIESLNDCLVCNPNIALECVKSSFGFIGTGTIVNIKSGDTVIDTYTMIINGDIDGDGVSDVLDAVLAERALHGCGELSAAQAYAANNSADTEIDAESYQNVVNRALSA